ncbi:MAG: hypothetical protein JNL18_24755 [Planctomycetaceae bacterium]|uniref:Uncharacterized protein n=1 Tax=Lacipirellula limnantheis TaxID=2528024 RepID=A0A517TVV9_9BACT|nr:hypothetical protein [Lacipirellula limnantheis]MBL9165955.1 hypothetical protein [Planctomycetaceae bacterium]QDT72508.1 hypothetical protein I41_16880 [Lacipirellula limnantheis]
MDASITQLPVQLRDALDAQGGAPLYLRDDQTQKEYVLFERHIVAPVDDDYLRRLLAEADEDIARGDVAPFDAEEIMREGRRLFAERQARLNK